MSYSIIDNVQVPAVPTPDSPLGVNLLVTTESNVDLPAGSLVQDIVSSSDWTAYPQAIQDFLDYISPRSGGNMHFHIVVQNVAEDPTEAVDRVKDGLTFGDVVYMDDDVFTVANIALMDALGLAMSNDNKPIGQQLKLIKQILDRSTVALTFKRDVTVAFVGDTTSGALNITNIADTSALKVGQLIEMVGIVAGSVIASKDASSITVDNLATITDAGVSGEAFEVSIEVQIKTGRAFKRTSFDVTGTTTLDSDTLTAVSSTVSVEIGQEVQGVGIPVGAKVIAKDASTVQLNKTATASGAGITVTFTTLKTYFSFPAGVIPGGDVSVDVTGTAIASGSQYDAVPQDTINELETPISGLSVNNAAASSTANSQTWDEYREAINADGRWDKWIFAGQVNTNVGLNQFAHYVANRFKYSQDPQYPPGYGTADPIGGMPPVQTYYNDYVPKSASIFMRGTGDGIGKRIIDAYVHDGSTEFRFYPGSQLFTQSTDQFKRPEHFLLYQHLWYTLLPQIQAWADNPQVRLATVAGLDDARLELVARISEQFVIGDVSLANLFKFDPVVIFGSLQSSNGALYPELEGLSSPPGRFQVVMNFWPTPTASRFTIINTLKLDTSETTTEETV
ncbi:hypothetical protein KAR91_87310 [Candidatus Pacearchaeota archaeon]|nr:hypothetical protein [Candidatus Pacearchaeota archaeon]